VCPFALSFHPDSSLLAVSDNMGRVAHLDLRSGRCAMQTGDHAHLGRCTAVVWSPCGARFASGGTDRIVHLWDARQLSQGPCLLFGHDDVITSLSFRRFVTLPSTTAVLPQVLISTSLDGTMRWWDLLGNRGQLRDPIIAPSAVRDHCWLNTTQTGAEGDELFMVSRSCYWHVVSPLKENLRGHEVQVTETQLVVEGPKNLGREAAPYSHSEEDSEDEMETLRKKRRVDGPPLDRKAT
jgi:WD40 repeat protein